jgi:protein-tyrosine phosphatase
MIDLHTHILPYFDGGANTMEESLRMCRMAKENGINTLVATLHNLVKEGC